tara:strand:- start:116 stop:817 length:702 start_codon:yes stop_codon:yes gene_type:complete
LDELPTLDNNLMVFGHNRWGVLSFYDSDHGPRDGTRLRSWIDQHLEAAGINLRGGPVKLLCFPRIFGFVFNPLSIWYCYDNDGRLRAVLYEVRNTFNESHSYLIKINCPTTSSIPPHVVRKRFYVSPFLQMACTYTFRLTEPKKAVTLHIRQSDEDETVLLATMMGKQKSLDSRNLALSIFAFPLMTIKVVAAIHWEALKLWTKKVPLVPKPSPPKNTVTIAQIDTDRQTISA